MKELNSQNINTESINPKIGIIGSGFMGTSIAKGLLKNYPGIDITISDIDENKLQSIKKQINVKISTNNKQICEESDVIFIAVKPNIIYNVLENIITEANNKLIISIVAGVTIKNIKEYLRNSFVIRVMPNICAQVQAGAIAYCPDDNITEQQIYIVHNLLSSLGLALKTTEKMLDAVTGLSGSGPAYIFMAIEALSDGGVLCGLPRKISNQLAAQTVLGSAKMYLESNLHAGTLKDMVTSPGGTTIQGVKTLESEGYRNALIKAVEAGCEQSKKFSKK